MKLEGRLFLTFLIISSYFVQIIGWAEYSKMNLVRAIVDENRFEIDSFYNNTGDRSYYNGHYYSDKAPGQSFLSTPIYLIAKNLFNLFLPHTSQQSINYVTNKIIRISHSETKTYEVTNPGLFYLATMVSVIIFTASLPFTLTVLLVFRIGKYLLNSRKKGILIGITYGLGSLAFIYSTVFFTHVLSAFLIFLSFYLLFIFREKIDIKILVISGILSGLSFVVEYSTSLIAFLLLIYTLRFKQIRLTFVFLISMLLGALPLLIYNFSITHNPFKLIYSFTDPSIRTDVGEKMGFTSLPNVFIIYRHLFDPYRGLFFYHPVLLFSLLGTFWAIRKYKYETLIILFSFLGFLIAFSMRDVNFFDFGSCFGARYYVSLMPFFMFLMCFALEKIDFFVFKILLIISVFNNILGLQNWESLIGDTYSVYIAEPYRSKINSFEVLANPLKTHYFPLFIENGPRARIVENLLEGRNIFEVRHFFSTKNNYPFITLIPLVFILLFIWRREFKSARIFKFLLENPEIIYIPIIQSLLLLI
jgi:4-amino-4-deoxy-L-arabinose transferase-like glycosyltransferase